MGFKEEIVAKATQLGHTKLLLPESTDERVLQASKHIVEHSISKEVVLFGDVDIVHNNAMEFGIDLSASPLANRVRIIDPSKDARLAQYAQQYYTKRKHKGLSEAQATTSMHQPLFFASMMMHNDEASAMVAGCVHTTADVLRAAIQIVGVAEDASVVSSCFVMEATNGEFNGTAFGNNGQFIFADCGIIPKPSSEELVAITLASARSCKSFLGCMPIISLLSFSTKGSANHPEVDRVRKAVELLQQQHPDLLIDGEMQMDAAINPKIAALKAPNSPTAGKSNTLIFPDLATGNIAYKTAQQFGNMHAYGPFIQGLAKPISDLSRGCSWQEIVTTSAATLCQVASER